MIKASVAEMATGIVKGEKVGADAVTADVLGEEAYALPEDDAPVVLSYPNKLSVEDVLAPITRKFAVYREGEFKPNWRIGKENALILADNFYALHSLTSKMSGKVNLIYMDPPFQTGMEFHSRQLTHAYKDTLGQAPYLEFMRRRLIVMRELLSEEGSLYLHIGHQMVFHLKVILDEVFGRQNFRNLIVRRKCSSKNYTKKQYPNLNDYILFYSKTKNYIWNKPGVKPTEEWIQKEYPKTDDKGRRYKLVPIHAPGIRNGETGKKWRGKLPPKGKHWQLSPRKLDELDANGDIHWSRNGNPRRKVYLTSDKKVSLTDYWKEFRDAHHQSIRITGYPTEKNLNMLKTIVEASSNKGDFVIDPFCGSGTTLHAAQELGRKWIGVDASFSAVEATLSRLCHGLQPMGDYVERKQPKAVDLFSDSDVVDLRRGKQMVEEAAKFDFIVDGAFLDAHEDVLKELASLLRACVEQHSQAHHEVSDGWRSFSDHA